MESTAFVCHPSCDLSILQNELLLKGYSTQSVSNIMFYVLTLFNYAHNDLMWISQNQVRNFRPLKPDSKESSYWTKDQILSFFSHKETIENHHYDLYVFLINTGLRIGEAAALTFKDIDLKKRNIYVGWTQARGGTQSEDYDGVHLIINRQKGKLERYVPMNDTIFDMLKKRSLNRDSDDFIFENGGGYIREMLRIDQNNKKEVIKGNPINASHFSHNRFNSLLRRIGNERLKTITVHGLRHTFASHYIMNGGDLYTLSRILGHSSVKITERYAHLSPNYMADVHKFVEFKEGECLALS